MNKDVVLPLGTVVKAAGEEVPVMIVGYGLMNSEDETTYDYAAVIFPVGLLPDKMVLFNENQIEDIIFIGYQNVRSLKYRQKVSDYIKKIKENGNQEEALKELLDSLGVEK